ncbi:MAG: hypothetical protein H0T79_09680 [Deltaproteobacteria bacterium]|nr:hypothetical protein [Deltaproteobacteria bacterium]
MLLSVGVLGVLAVLCASARPAAAEAVAGTYEVKYEVMANNCSSELLKFARGELKIDIKGAGMTVDIQRVPIMNGKAAKTGKIAAKSKPQGGHTAVAGMDGVFSVAGRVQNGLLSLVFVGEYHTAADRKSLCTQSWNISGTRKDDAPSKSPPKSPQPAK